MPPPLRHPGLPGPLTVVAAGVGAPPRVLVRHLGDVPVVDGRGGRRRNRLLILVLGVTRVAACPRGGGR